ncbi:MAG: response regulator [Spirochaetales bacterium]|nr:response regulator [Spirochaetales bacterium]
MKLAVSGALLFLITLLSLAAETVPEIHNEDIMYRQGSFFRRQVEYRPGIRPEDVPADLSLLYDGGSLPGHDSPEIREFVFSTYFRVLPSLREKTLALYIGPTNFPAEVYLNGVLVHISGQHIRKYNSMTYRSQTVLLSRDILCYGDDQNVLTFAVFPTSEMHPLFRTGIAGFDKVERKVFLYSFLNYYFIQGSVIVSIFLCIFFSLLYARGGFKEKIYLYFGLINVMYCFSYVNMFFDSHANNEVLTEIISRMSFPIVGLMMLFFFMEYTKILHRNKLMKAIPLIVSLCSAILILVQKDKYGVEKVFVYVRNLVVTPTLLFVLVLLFYSILKRRQAGVRFIFITTLIQTVFGLHDSININLHRVPTVWLIPYGYTFLIISIFIVLAVEQSQMYFKLYRQRQDLAMVRNEVALRRESERKLKEAVKAADAASNAKSMFLANMSHEIRTPLNAILGYSELIFKGENSGEHSRYAEVLYRESDHLMQLVNKVLDISKIESGKLSIEASVFRLQEVLDFISGNFTARCRQKGIEFRFDKAADVPEMIWADRTQFQQILNNLLDNAFKFTEKGHIELKVWKDKNLFFSVKDTGIGIELNKQKSIFESFVQADSSTTRKYGGTGLGISISRQLARILGGELTVESTPGEGSVFTFFIPVPAETRLPRQREKMAENDVPDLHDYTLLLVEDNPTNQEVICLNLKKTNIRIITAEDGEEGVKSFGEHCPDLVLMDVQMPVLDGYEATRQIRQKSGGSIVPIIGLTANVFEKDRSLCRAAGMNDVLIKPLPQADLYQLLREYLLGSPVPGSVKAGFNPARLEDELGIDRQTAFELVSGFIRDTRKGMETLQTSLQEGDWKTAHRTAHSIKGGAMNIFVDGMFILARKTEKLCLDHQKERAGIMSRHLLRALDVLEKELAEYGNGD